LDMLRKLRSL